MAQFYRFVSRISSPGNALDSCISRHSAACVRQAASGLMITEYCAPLPFHKPQSDHIHADLYVERADI